MKTHHYLLSFVMAFFFMHHTFAKVIRVDNNPGTSADYKKLQEAINSAESGDTIYVVGSPNWYDTNSNGYATDITINRTLTLIGPGYFLGDNSSTQASKHTAKIYRLTIGEGADNCTIQGFDLNANNNAILYINKKDVNGKEGSIVPKNVTIKRNLINRLEIRYANNTLISQNYFSINTYPIYVYQGAANTIIRNNIISSGNRHVSIYGDNSELINLTIENNTFTNGFYRINNATIQNNIFISGILNDCDNNTLNNNLFTSTEEAVSSDNSTANTFNNNIFEAVQANIFVEPSPTLDDHFRLATDSPAIGMGVGGEDLGAYGGPTPYKLSGLPAIPAIYDLNTVGVGTQTEGMTVEIKAKSHN